MYRTLLAACIALTACSQSSQSKLSVDLLRLPPPAEFQVEKIEIKSVTRASQAPELFGPEGLSSSAYYKYWREDGSAYKVRINVYDTVEQLQAGWHKRFPPDTLLQVEALQDPPGFIAPGKLGAVQIGTVLLEVAPTGGAPDFPAFLTVYAAFVEQTLDQL